MGRSVALRSTTTLNKARNALSSLKPSVSATASSRASIDLAH
nr:hypothetical protein [Pseudomonas furukawaii]